MKLRSDFPGAALASLHWACYWIINIQSALAKTVGTRRSKANLPGAPGVLDRVSCR